MSEVFDKELIDKAKEPIPWYIKVALWFVKTRTGYDHTEVEPGSKHHIITISKYKIFKGRIYLLSVKQYNLSRPSEIFRESGEAFKALGAAWAAFGKAIKESFATAKKLEDITKRIENPKRNFGSHRESIMEELKDHIKAGRLILPKDGGSNGRKK